MSAHEGYKVEENLKASGRDDSFLFFFLIDSKEWCIDATEYDGMYGRLVNHSRLRPNCKVHAIMLDGSPALILKAIRDIRPGEELLYDYGEIRPDVLEELPWIQNS